MIFTRSHTDFTTRLMINNKNIEQLSAVRLLGVWISNDLSWQLNCEQLCKKAYSRLSLLTKLKYVGTKREDLLDIYKLFIRSTLDIDYVSKFKNNDTSSVNELITFTFS